MSERTHDELFAAAIGDFRAATLPSIRPQGTAAAQRRAGERRRNQALVLCAALLLLLALPVAALAQYRPDRGPAPVTASPSPLPSGSVSPSASATAEPSPTTTPVGTSPTTSPRSTGATGTGSGVPRCLPGGHISVAGYDGPGMGAEVDALKFLCPGEKIYFFWATYTVQDADTLVLAASGRSYVDHTHVSRSIPAPGYRPNDTESCTALVIVQGRGSIRSTLAWNAEGESDKSVYGSLTRMRYFPYHFACDPRPAA
ncbi:hypothetical protein QEZ54_26205 [Catellatospora sp. KI3]|uniref:hypothetical protein n=1 Tax=Catellatospora sp. KI3 TaxID=3041620 RepID=UPI00248310E4|nr:hypothetical protein [Catellatospora sp. KI3]MDI1464471.1 hypothetical protein [Catellatospora sp. KI3]